ncbi:sensor histidine kinase [Thioalkalivibrio sp.]|uniref:sensor histidine kinase n=1 Tax=Thioalkalivibrio sp. TaxID=2093813 RepID=UPI0035652B92
MKSLNSYLLIASAILFLGVVTFGAISVMSVHAVSEKARMIETEARNIAFIGRLQDQAHQLLLAEHHYLLDPQQNAFARDRAESIGNALRADLSDHLAYEEATAYPESLEEVRLLRELDAVVRSLAQLTSPEGNSLTGAVPPQVLAEELLQRGEQIKELLTQVNALHFDIIARKIGMAEGHFSFLLQLFLGLSLLGLFIVWLGYMLHSRYVVSPVKSLARTAHRLAAGDLSTRADTHSRTEIGVLYRSFNEMAETIQRHERDLSRLTQELERRVEDRTRSLEQAYASLQRTQRDLVRMERLATLGQIATTVNHEIKTPLNTLYINLQLLKRAARTSMPSDSAGHSEILHLISMIDHGVLRISSYLDEFVNYARFPPSHPRRTDTNALVGEVMETFSQKAEEAGVRIEARLDTRLQPLLLDERTIVQAIVNLCANALDAMPDGGTLSLATRAEDDCGIIEVSDTGTGIDPEDQERIFTPFFTRKETGLGFGLAIVQRIAEDHGGSVSCTSRPGQGSTFTLRLPIDQSAMSPDDEPESAQLEYGTS